MIKAFKGGRRGGYFPILQYLDVFLFGITRFLRRNVRCDGITRFGENFDAETPATLPPPFISFFLVLCCIS